MGPDPGDLKEIRLLNRIIGWEQEGIRFEADQRHAEIMTKTLQLEHANGVDTPGTSAAKASEEEEEDEELPHNEIKPYRGCAARCNFLGLDRPDIQYAAKEVSRAMAKPYQSNVKALKRMGRYLQSYPRAVFMYKFQAPQTHKGVQ